MEYGLIGENVTYSFSPEIHNQFNNNNYSLLSLNDNQFNEFILSRDFKGINVTMPYKEKVIPYLDYIDETARKIGVVNTIINNSHSTNTGSYEDIIGSFLRIISVFFLCVHWCTCTNEQQWSYNQFTFHLLLIS